MGVNVSHMREVRGDLAKKGMPVALAHESKTTVQVRAETKWP
jgi:hypothetical protein